MTAFAEAVAAGDFRKAEGWLAVARFARERVPDRGSATSTGHPFSEHGPAA